jgi:hypothetical protein
MLASTALLSFCLRVDPDNGFSPSALGALPQGQLESLQIAALLADNDTTNHERYGVPERFWANCAFGGR